LKKILLGKSFDPTPEILKYEEILLSILEGLPKNQSNSKGGSENGPLIVDIGANLGHLSLVAASLGFRSIAYEPNPDFAEKFRMSVALNGFYNSVTVVEAAVSDQIGDVEIAVPTDPKKAADTGIFLKDESLNREENSFSWKEVQMVRADYSVEWISMIEDIHLLRVSVGGHEFRVLKGATNLFKTKRIRAILLRFSPQGIIRNGDEPMGLLMSLAELGFSLSDSNQDTSPFNMQTEFKRLVALTDPVDLLWIKTFV